MKNGLKLELASNKDVLTIYYLRNEKEARRNSLDYSKIKLLEHFKWFVRNKKNKSEIIYIVKISRKKIGYLRIRINGECGEISYCIGKRWRNKGYGTQTIKLIENLNIPLISQVRAIVKKDNTASMKVFKKLQYSEKNMEENVVFYKDLSK